MDEHDCYANRLQLVSQGHTFICLGHYQLEMISAQVDLFGYNTISKVTISYRILEVVNNLNVYLNMIRHLYQSNKCLCKKGQAK